MRGRLEVLTPEDKTIIAQSAEIMRLRAVVIVAERVCRKLESPTASVTIVDQTELRAALDAAAHA